MTDFITASPLLILGLLIVLSWFTGNKGLKLITVLAFFFIPVVMGNVQFDLSEQFIKDVLNFWINEAVDSLFSYLKEHLFS